MIVPRLSKVDNAIGWAIAVLGTAVYLLTLEPSVSFWDCGEFIATSYGLQIGHPPGAPLYQLIAHCFMLLAGENVTMLAWWSNALSAVAGGITAMFLYWTLLRLIYGFREDVSLWKARLGAAVGALCYLFCDTAWFSAVESEVYSLSMLFSAAILWTAVRWWQSGDEPGAARWSMLTALLLGMSVGIHQLSLLTLPVQVLVYIFKHKETPDNPDNRVNRIVRRVALWFMFFAIGLTPYIILPIRAAADTPINQGNPSTLKAFKSYITRDQYEKAPLVYGRCFNSPIVAYANGKPVYAKEMDMLFPRMWKHHSNAELYYTDWTGRHGRMVEVGGKEYYKPSQGDNLLFFGGYQLGYMYLRYLMWNYAGRYDDRQGFGNLQKGQFITGFPFIDRLYVGTSARRPKSLDNAGYNRYFLLPLLLGIIGVFALRRRDRRSFWTVMTLFLMSSLALAIYLNHPVYEPRERDYAYILSFYAFAVWIGVGAYALISKEFKREKLGKLLRPLVLLAVCGTPLLMALQNWDDHNRSGRYIARDSAANLLNSCDENAILFTVGDNDTFPLWYLQQVEKERTDVQVVNLSLLGSESYCESIKKQFSQQGGDLLCDDEWRGMGPYRRMKMILENNQGQRPVFFSHYAQKDYADHFGKRLQLHGIAYRLADSANADGVDCESCHRLMTGVLKWQSLEGVYIDETSSTFLRQYWNDALQAAKSLALLGEQRKGAEVLDATFAMIIPELLQSPKLYYDIAKAYAQCGEAAKAASAMRQARYVLSQQLEYYYTMPARMREYIPYTMAPLLALQDSIYGK